MLASTKRKLAVRVMIFVFYVMMSYVVSWTLWYLQFGGLNTANTCVSYTSNGVVNFMFAITGAVDSSTATCTAARIGGFWDFNNAPDFTAAGIMGLFITGVAFLLISWIVRLMRRPAIAH